jgi:hypothetical protein
MKIEENKEVTTPAEMKIEENDSVDRRSSFKKLFYVNRNNFKVTVEPDADGKLGKVRTTKSLPSKNSFLAVHILMISP